MFKAGDRLRRRDTARSGMQTYGVRSEPVLQHGAGESRRLRCRRRSPRTGPGPSRSATSDRRGLDHRRSRFTGPRCCTDRSSERHRAFQSRAVPSSQPVTAFETIGTECHGTHPVVVKKRGSKDLRRNIPTVAPCHKRQDGREPPCVGAERRRCGPRPVTSSGSRLTVARRQRRAGLCSWLHVTRPAHPDSTGAVAASELSHCRADDPAVGRAPSRPASPPPTARLAVWKGIQRPGPTTLTVISLPTVDDLAAGDLAQLNQAAPAADCRV